MYLQMFGFQEKPFHITPNPRFIFLSKNHKEAFAHLLYGIRQRVGFLSLTGEVGTGKTTVLRTLLGQLEESAYRVALIFNPCLSALELLQAVHKEFAIEFDPEQSNLVRLHDSLNSFLLRQREAGKTVVLVVDEAQNLDPSVLEQLRLLSNLETETEKLIQMILVGQPELDQILLRNDLRQLRQRLAVRYHLRPMDIADTAAYVRHRLKVAGWQGGELFTEGALRRAFKYSGGNPRLINILCDRALLVAYGRDSRTVSPADVRVAQSELEPRKLSRRNHYLPAMAIGMVLLLLLLFGPRLISTLPPPEIEAVNTSDPKLPAEPAPAVSKEPVEGKSTDRERIDQLKAAIASISPDESFQRSFVALTELWQKTVPPAVNSTGSLLAALRNAGFTAVEMEARLTELTEMNVPVILRVVLPGIPGKRYFVLTDVEGASVRIEPALTESGWLSREELEQLWFGKVILPYVNFQGITIIKQPGQGGGQIQALQTLLKLAGADPVSDSGVYDQQTIEAVTRFQAEHQLAPDGRVGAKTLFRLYKDAGLKMPRLVSGGAS